MPGSVAGKSYVITGGASLVGSHLADKLLAGGASEVRLLENFALGTPDTIAHLQSNPKVKLIRGDILRLNEMIDATAGTAGVFALAGFLTLPMSQNPALGAAVNSVGMVNVLEAARIGGAKRVIFSSSTAVYGNSNPPEMVEDTPYVSAGLTPASAVYSASKLLGEGLCALYSRLHGVEFNVLRFSTVYGERQHWRAVNAAFLAEIYERVRKGESPVIAGDGKEVHDYIHVDDVAQACLLAMTSEANGQTMNVATGTDTTLTELADAIIAAAGAKNLAIKYMEDTRTVKSSSVNHLRNSRARAERLIGWTPKVSLSQGVARYIAWREAEAAKS